MRKSDQYAAKAAEQAAKKNETEEDIAAQLGEEDTAWDKVKRLCKENKLAAFSALVILLGGIIGRHKRCEYRRQDNQQDHQGRKCRQLILFT